MKSEVRQRIDQIRRGEVPRGYKKTKAGILPVDWTIYLIKDCLERVEHPVSVQADEMYTQIGIRSHGKGLFYKEPISGESLGKKAVFWIEPDCFVLNIVFAWEQAIGKTTQNEVGMIGSHRFPMYRSVDGRIDIDYLIEYLMTKRGKDILEAASPGGAGRNRTLGQERFMKSKIILPTKSEQQKIAEIIKLQERVIELNSQIIKQLELMKKACLRKMFPEHGSSVPEVRFPGFTAPWEQRKLDDWGTFYYGKSCPKWSVTEDAKIPCIRYGELYTKFGAKIDKVYSYTNMSPENLRFSKGTEVLIPRVGEDPMDYNHCTWLSVPNVAIGEMISVFNTENNPLFTATMFNATLQQEFAMRVEGGSVTNLYFEKLKNIEVSFPTIDEQERIANYFESLDNLIALQQRKRDEEKQKKKALMQLLFSGIVRVKV